MKSCPIKNKAIDSTLTSHSSLPKQHPQSSIPLIDGVLFAIKPHDEKTINLLKYIADTDTHLHKHLMNHSAHLLNFSTFLNLTKAEVNELFLATLFHDIGKVYMTDITNLQRKLTPTEWQEIERHVMYSYILVKKNNFSRFVQISALYHHYYKGYPRVDGFRSELNKAMKHIGISLQDNEIPLLKDLSKREWYMLSIIILLDIFDAVTDEARPYRKPMILVEVLDFFKEDWGINFEDSLKKPFEEYLNWLSQTRPHTDGLSFLQYLDLSS